jgi:anti-sigma factor (TIGR02949 family)
MNEPNSMETGSMSMGGMGDMLDCESVMRQLWDYLDRQLTPETIAAIDGHLDKCQRCRPQADFRRAFERAVSAAREDVGDTSVLRERIRRALQDEEHAGR